MRKYGCSNCGNIKGAIMKFKYQDSQVKAYRCTKCGGYEYENIEKEEYKCGSKIKELR